MFIELLRPYKESSDDNIGNKMRFPYILNSPSERILSYASVASSDETNTDFSSDKVLENILNNLLKESDSRNFELPIRRLQKKLNYIHRMAICCLEPVVGEINQIK